MHAARLTLLTAALLAAVPARAGEDGLTLGVRAGLGFAFGKIDGSTTVGIADVIPTVFPLWLEVGYRFDRHWSMNAFFQYGPATTDRCPPGYDCPASDQRLGATAIYRFDQSSFTPWMGIGAGYEWLNYEYLNVDSQVQVKAGGLELNLQIGGDFHVTPGIGIGPYLCFSLSQFSGITVSGVPHEVIDKTAHGWIQIGVKGTFDL